MTLWMRSNPYEVYQDGCGDRALQAMIAAGRQCGKIPFTVREKQSFDNDLPR